MSDRRWFRMGMALVLDEEAPEHLDRVRFMHLMHLLQEVMGVPLGHTFQMRHFGPFSRGVLDDLDAAHALRDLYPMSWMPSDMDPWQKSNGMIPRSVKDLVAHHVPAAIALLGMFNRLYSQIELTIIAAVVHVDRQELGKHETITVNQITQLIWSVMPDVREVKILECIRDLQSLNMLRAVEQWH